MKVLFAVSNEEISESIVKRYQKEYKEIISYKNVYYFNAILRELQKDKSYDRIVISEDLEAFSHTQYDQIDKFIFERLDNISDEAINLSGEDIPIIIICADRRTKSEPMLSRIFGIGIYNALLGNDRSVEQVCKLIHKPRVKREAKTYYKIESEEVKYQPESENDVSEIEIQNILAHFKRLGKNEDKFVESFNSISEQYNDAQLKVICKFLPLNVRATLEEKSPKYQKLVAYNKSVSENLRKNKKAEEDESGTTERLLKPKTQEAIMKKPVVIPSSVNMSGKKKLAKKPATIEKEEFTENSIPQKVQEIKNQERKEFEKIQQISQEKEGQARTNKQKEVKEIEQPQPEKIIEKNEIANSEIPSDIPEIQDLLEDLPVKPVKRGRGRPRKQPVEQEEIVNKPKRGRGRPKKQPVEQQNIANLEEMTDIQLNDASLSSNSRETNTTLQEFNNSTIANDESVLPGFEDEEDTLLPGFEEDDDTTLPGFEDEEDNTLFSKFNDKEDDTVLPGFDEEENDISLPGFDEEEDYQSLPGGGNNHTPQTSYQRSNLNNSSSFEEDEETTLSGFQRTNFEPSYSVAESDIYLSRKNAKKEKDAIESEIDIASLLTANNKIACFVGTSKNGTSFIVNNIAQILSEKGIDVAILDTTQNRNSYYIYTKNEEDLRILSTQCIENLINGVAKGIQVSKNLTVYTALEDERELIENSGEILQTLVKNHSVVLVDCDFDTPINYFRKAQEIYLVQTLDVLTIQPLTAFLKELKTKNILDEKKLRIILNKVVKVRGVNEKTIIGGMAFYNDPAMSFMTELFDRNLIKYIAIPFDEEVYAKYLGGLIDCDISLKGYPKNIMQSLQELASMIYPNVSGKVAYKPPTLNSNNGFSASINSTLDQMKKY